MDEQKNVEVCEDDWDEFLKRIKREAEEEIKRDKG